MVETEQIEHKQSLNEWREVVETRVGRSNQRLSPEETHRLWEMMTGRTWDALPCAELRLEHLDRGAVEDFLHKSGQDPRGSTESVLQNLCLMTEGGLANGAALLFAENPQRFIVGSQVKCGRFLGLTSVQFLDEQTLDGTVMSQVDRAMAFVTRNTRQGIRFTGRPSARSCRSIRPRPFARRSPTPCATATTLPPARCRCAFTMIDWKSGIRGRSRWA
jgi:predicted HTH transcriptional regulator